MKKTKQIHGWPKPAILILIAFLLGYFLSGGPQDNGQADQHAHSEENTMWTCSMHPQIQQPKPGKCPICAMDLIPVTTGTGEQDTHLPSLQLSPAAIARAEIQTVPVTRRRVKADIRVFGKIGYDKTRIRVIAARFPGRIDKMYIDYPGQTVQKGDALVDIYSPELITAQQELLLVNGQENNSLVDAGSVRQKLLFWGFENHQIDKIQESAKIYDNLTVHAPITGVVIDLKSLEGEYIRTGTLLYKIADLSAVWANFDVYEPDIGFIREGQSISIKLEAYPGQNFGGRIEFINPVMDEKTRVISVRASVPNPGGRLKPGMFLTADIESALTGKRPPLVIPVSAPLLTGRRAVVYVADAQEKGRYVGKTVRLGARLGGFYQVIDGLDEGEKVVTNGSFKIDSELQLRGKPSMMNPAGGAETAHHQSPAMHGVPEADRPASHDTQDHSPAPVHHNVAKEFKQQLKPVYNGYFRIQQALSQDDLAASQAPAGDLVRALQKPDMSLLDGPAHDQWMSLQKSAIQASRGISTAKDIETARSEFEKLSIAMIELAETIGTSGSQLVVRYHCPMAFNDKGADWLQNKKGVENPYYGSQMFRCGSEVKVLSDPRTAGGKK